MLRWDDPDDLFAGGAGLNSDYWTSGRRGAVTSLTRELLDEYFLRVLYGPLWKQAKEIRALPEATR